MSRYKNSIDAAINLVVRGAEIDIPVSSNGQGRPPNKRVVNDVILDREEYDVYLALKQFWKTVEQLRTSSNDIMTDEEFVALQKRAAPLLNKRMIDMALVSDDLKAVRQVASDLADRGYGKSATQINVNVSDKDLRGAWKQLENRNIIDVSNLIEVVE